MLNDTSAQLQFAFGLLLAIFCVAMILNFLLNFTIQRSTGMGESFILLVVSGVFAFFLIGNVFVERPQRTNDHNQAVADITPLGYEIDHLSVADNKVTLILGNCRVPFDIAEIDGKWGPSVLANRGGIWIDTAVGKDVLDGIAHSPTCS